MLGVVLFAARWGILVCRRSSRLGRGCWVALGGAGSRWGCRWVVVLGGWAWGGAAGGAAGYMVAAGRDVLGLKSRRRAVLL